MKTLLAVTITTLAVAGQASAAVSTPAAGQAALRRADQTAQAIHGTYPEAAASLTGCTRRGTNTVDCFVTITNRTGTYIALVRVTPKGARYLSLFFKVQ